MAVAGDAVASFLFCFGQSKVDPHVNQRTRLFRGGGKMVKVGGLGGGLLRVACSGFYVHLKSVFPLIRFLKRVFRELIYRFR